MSLLVSSTPARLKEQGLEGSRQGERENFLVSSQFIAPPWWRRFLMFPEETRNKVTLERKGVLKPNFVSCPTISLPPNSYLKNPLGMCYHCLQPFSTLNTGWSNSQIPCLRRVAFWDDHGDDVSLFVLLCSYKIAPWYKKCQPQTQLLWSWPLKIWENGIQAYEAVVRNYRYIGKGEKKTYIYLHI